MLKVVFRDCLKRKRNNKIKINITSKFRQMYWVKQIFFFVAGLFFATLFFNASIMSDGNLNFQYTPCWIGIIISVFLILHIISILTFQTVHVTQKGVEFIYLFFNKSKIVHYDTIVNIERKKTQQMVKAGPVSDGYHLSVLHLMDGKQEIISPDHFENYTDIIHAIKSNLKHKI